LRSFGGGGVVGDDGAAVATVTPTTVAAAVAAGRTPVTAVAATTAVVVAAAAEGVMSAVRHRWLATVGRAEQVAAYCRPTSTGPASPFRTPSRRTTGEAGGEGRGGTGETGPGQRPRPVHWWSS